MLKLTRALLVALSLALVLGSTLHGVAAAGMEQTMASVATTDGGAMGDCDACTGKTMKSGALCDLACNPPVAIAVTVPNGPDSDLLLTDYGLIPNLRADGRVPAINPSPPRPFTLI